MLLKAQYSLDVLSSIVKCQIGEQQMCYQLCEQQMGYQDSPFLPFRANSYLML